MAIFSGYVLRRYSKMQVESATTLSPWCSTGNCTELPVVSASPQRIATQTGQRTIAAHRIAHSFAHRFTQRIAHRIALHNFAAHSGLQHTIALQMHVRREAQAHAPCAAPCSWVSATCS